VSHWNLTWAALLAAITFSLPGTNASASVRGDDAIACDRAARDAEGEFGLPAGILVAIGSVESGHWPWSANVDGAAETYRSKDEAIEALTRVRTPRPADVDVGCFQISLRYHPAAFATMADALDPATNARYAARFLRELRGRLGDWDHAVAAYHNAAEPLEAAYHEHVMARWKDAPAVEGLRDTPAAAPLRDAPAAEQPRWRIISIAAALPPAGGPRALPQVITLGN
jgi:hypothetical protein